jgi:hypothetical protein
MVLAYVACFAGVQTLWLVSALLLAPSGFYPFIYAVIFFNPIIYAVLFLTMTTVSILMGGGVLTTQR